MKTLWLRCDFDLHLLTLKRGFLYSTDIVTLMTFIQWQTIKRKYLISIGKILHR
jgi:hypothetical protein